jgi:glycosyltransferase involved in cell wall biosynthesis
MLIEIMMQSCDESMAGIGIYTQEVVRALLELDPVNSYLLVFPGFGRARERIPEFSRFRNVTVVETWFPRLPAFFHTSRLLTWIPRLLKKARALTPIETYWDQVVVPRLARKYRADVVFNPHLTVPVRGRFGKVMVLHNVEYHTVPNVYGWRMYAWWWLLEHVIMPRADRVISLSGVMTADFRKYVDYPIEQVRTIYHGVSKKFRVETDATRLAQARQQHALPERFILFVGRLYPQKNFVTVARAFALIRDVIPHQLVVVGIPRYKFQGDLGILDERGIADRVRFLGHVPNDDLVMFYNLADCFVYPSLYESFGLAQLEAMACGCPVIGADSGAIPEIAGGAAELFEARNAQALAEAIVRVTCEPGVRGSLVERGLRRAREFTWERTARETLKVLNEVAEAPRAPG